MELRQIARVLVRYWWLVLIPAAVAAAITLPGALAQEAGVPPYVIFHDSTLRDMAAIRPKSLRDMALVSGVGERKLEAYGEAFLAALRPFI